MNLALEFRPRKFGEVAGQPWVSLVLEMMVAKGEVPPGLLFEGPRGTGKTSTARILAAALNCEDGSRPCGQCESCRAVRQAGSVDVIEVDAATNGRAEDIRRLCDLVTYDVGSRNRVVILDEAHGVSERGFDVLLKTLEEPPPNVTWVLVTTEPSQVPETIRSRCMGFRFKRVGVRDVTARLVMIRDARGLATGDDVLAAIAERADGGLRDAVMLLDQVSRAGVSALAQFHELTGEGDFSPGLLQVMASGRLGELYERVDELVCEVGDPLLITVRLARCLRDVMVLRAGGSSVTAQGEALKARRALASRLTEAQLVGAMRVLWDLQKIRSGNDPRMVLDLAVVMIAEQFAPARDRAQASPNGNGNGNGHHKASIEEIRALAGG